MKLLNNFNFVFPPELLNIQVMYISNYMLHVTQLHVKKSWFDFPKITF